MKKTGIILLCTVLSVSLCGCVSQKDYDALAADAKSLAEKAEAQEERIGTLESDVSKMEEQLDSLAPYESIINNMQNENYDAVIAEANEKKTEKMKEEAGDIEDYLVTVELTSENFEEYFKFVDMYAINGFGEVEGWTHHGIQSLQYDNDLILYKTDKISVEYNYGGGYTSDGQLEHLLGFSSNGIGDLPNSFAGRITEGTVTFIKKEYVASYDIPERETPDQWFVNAIITLKNGEVIYRSVCPEYPY